MASEPVRPENSKRSLSIRVSKLIRVQLERGKVGVETVAGQLNMSRYTCLLYTSPSPRDS